MKTSTERGINESDQSPAIGHRQLAVLPRPTYAISAGGLESWGEKCLRT